MEPELARRIAAEIERGFKQAGASDFAEGTATASAILCKLQEWLSNLRTVEQLSDALVQVEVSPDDMAMFVSAAENLTPVVAVALRRIANRFEREFPLRKGKKPTLPFRARREVCRFIGYLLGEGADLPLAYKRAALRFGVSSRTIERVWGRRKKSDRASPDEVVDWLLN